MRRDLSWLAQYTDALLHFISHQLILAPLLLLFIEEAGIPIAVPGDAIIAYEGYKLSSPAHASEFWPAFIVAQISVLCGATILFFIARRWGKTLLDKIGKYLFLNEKQILRAQKLFAKYDVGAIIIGRHIPGLRIAVTFFAGTSGVKYLTFIISTFISTTAWILIFLTLGRKLGIRFHAFIQQYIGLSFYVTMGIVVLVIGGHVLGAFIAHKRAQHAAQ